METPSGASHLAPMSSDSVTALRIKAIRARRLARELNDPHAEKALLDMADELEAAADEIEKRGG